MTYDFSYLSQPFYEFYDAKQMHHGDNFIATQESIEYQLSEHEALFKKIGITQEEFEIRFLKGYYDLITEGEYTEEVLSEIIQILSTIVGKSLIFHHKLPIEPFSLSLNREKDQFANALDWTYIQIRELKLKGLDFGLLDAAVPEDDEPLYQCIFCGRLDEDVAGRKFNKKRKYCHAKNCQETKSVNPEHHMDCCYGQWAGKKKGLIQTLKRHYKGRQKGIDAFNKFCEERYQENLKRIISVRTAYIYFEKILETLHPNPHPRFKQFLWKILAKYDHTDFLYILTHLEKEKIICLKNSPN